MPLRDQRRCRSLAAAGKYYDADAIALRRRIASAEAKCKKETVSGILHGAVVPHGAYPFSLDLAVQTLLPVRNSSVKQVVLLGPSHRFRLRGVCVPEFDVWRTPFGEMPEYAAGRDLLLEMQHPLIAKNPGAHEGEHTLEVQLPLLQYFLGAVPVLPLVVGEIKTDELRDLGSLFSELDRPGTLWIVSSDFSHYGECFGFTPFGIPCDPAKLASCDLAVAERLASCDLDGFIACLGRTGATMCGAFSAALYLAMLAAYQTPVSGEIVGRCDTASVTGDYTKIVDYIGIRFFENGE